MINIMYIIYIIFFCNALEINSSSFYSIYPNKYIYKKIAYIDPISLYLSLTFHSVALPMAQMCSFSQQLVVPYEEGIISSHVAGRHGCDKPWRIQAQPGQRISINLMDFGGPQKEKCDNKG